jgi:RNA polymerase sigma-70 factor, ECF subfamily
MMRGPDSKLEAALEHAYRRHAPMMKLTARELLGDADSADDAVHQVFAKLLSASRSFPGEYSAAYLVRSVHNEAVTILRRRSRRRRLLSAATAPHLSEAQATPEDEVVQSEGRTLLAVRLDELPDRCRLVARLALQGYSRREIARSLGVSLKAIEKQMTRAYRLIEEPEALRRNRHQAAQRGRSAMIS